jgi:hypothetical protein
MTDNNATLTSVDFQGQGVIDDVELTADGTGLNFGTDSLAIAVTAGPGVELTGECAEGTLFYSGSSATVTFTLTKGYALASENKVYDADKTYSVEINPANYAGGYVIDSYLPAAFIGGTSYPTFAAALTAALSAGGEIKLMNDVPASLFEVGALTIDQGTTVEIDLNGFDIAAIYNSGTLKIKDSVGTGTVAKNDTLNASVYNEGTVTIEGGCFEAAITGGTITVSGGKFKVKPADTVLAAGLAFSTEATDGYYSVVTAPVAPAEPLPALPDNPTAEDVTEALGEQTDDAVAANVKTVEEYNDFKGWAEKATGGAAAVVASPNAWVAYALDNAGLLAGNKVTLADSDITVESFGQAENAAAGQFTLEISLKDVTIGNATTANLLKIFEAVGTTDLKADFTAGAVTTDVVAAGGKAKFTVAPSAANKPNAFFFKAQIKK